MYCIYCGKKLPDDARFCMSCGKQVVNIDEPNSLTEGSRKDLMSADKEVAHIVTNNKKNFIYRPGEIYRSNCYVWKRKKGKYECPIKEVKTDEGMINTNSFIWDMNNLIVLDDGTTLGWNYANRFMENTAQKKDYKNHYYNLYRIDPDGTPHYVNGDGGLGGIEHLFFKDGYAYWNTDFRCRRTNIFNDEPTEAVGEEEYKRLLAN